MSTANFNYVKTIDTEVFIHAEIETYDIGYSVEDCDIQVRSYFDKDNFKITGSFTIFVEIVSDKDSSKFIMFKYEDSEVGHMLPNISARLLARHIEDHNLSDEEYERLFGGAIDDLGYVTIKFE